MRSYAYAYAYAYVYVYVYVDVYEGGVGTWIYLQPARVEAGIPSGQAAHI